MFDFVSIRVKRRALRVEMNQSENSVYCSEANFVLYGREEVFFDYYVMSISDIITVSLSIAVFAFAY